MWIGHRIEIRKLTLRALVLRLSVYRVTVDCVCFIYWNMELREKQQNKLVEWKVFVDAVRIKSADFKKIFFFD